MGERSGCLVGPEMFENFGGARENDERIYGQSLRSRSEITKAWGIILQVCQR